jgi:hypothetical protein
MILRSALKSWLPLAGAILVLSLMIYVSVQQAYRSGANDPQIQLAEDAARALSAGEAADLPGTSSIDVANSLAVFHVTYDDQGRPVSGTARLNGALPSLPAGVLDYVRSNRQTIISWQPQTGVRSAIVVRRVNGVHPGFIMVGRSLREVERRVNRLIGMLLLGMGGALFGSLLLSLIAAWLFHDRAASSRHILAAARNVY